MMPDSGRERQQHAKEWNSDLDGREPLRRTRR